MLCHQKDVLLNAYIEATDRQAEAVTELVKSRSEPKAFRKARTAAEEAQNHAEQARIALKQHTETHGC
jgi:hypothetical protein